MKRTRLIRKLGLDAGWAAMRLAETLVRMRGTGYAVRLGRSVGAALWLLAGLFLRSRRDLSFRNARVVLPDLTCAERRRIVREAILRSSSYWPELMCHIHSGGRRILKDIAVEGRENLDIALARGKGVVVPASHLGNFALIGMWMAKAGYKFYYLSRFPHDERLQQRMAWLRRLSGIKVIRNVPLRACVSDCIATLSRGEIIFFQLDQRAGKAGPGVSVDFFGRPFHCFTGPVSFALKTGAAVVPMYIVREGGVRHRLVIEPEFVLDRTGDKRADVRSNLQRLMHRLEGWIRAHPRDWWWPNRRWEGV